MAPLTGWLRGGAVPGGVKRIAPLAAGLPPMVAPRHYPGAGFAGFHGPRAPALAGCAGAMETDTRALPELARARLARAMKARAFAPPRVRPRFR